MSDKYHSPYLENEYTPLKFADQSNDWIPLNITYGTIPPILNGYFLRNSSNPQHKPHHDYHWFDGDGYIQGVKFQSGKAFFKGKFIQTDKFLREQKEGKSLHGGLKSPLSANNRLKGIKDLLSFIFLGKNPFPNTSNTDLVYHHNTLFSLWMLCGNAYKIDPETLDTLGSYNFASPKNKHTGIAHGISAHPKVSPKDDTLFVMDFVHSWKRHSTPTLYLSSVSTDASEIKTQKIEVSGRHLLHDMAVTENYVIIADMPAEMSPLGLKYRHNKPARFGILRGDFQKIAHPKTQKQQDVLWFDDPSGCYIVHVINAYEEGDKIVLFALRKPHLELNRKLSNEITDVFDGYLHKWEFNLKTGEIENGTGTDMKPYFPIGSEFPTINEQYEGKKHQFSYLPSISRTPQFNFNAFSKYDHSTNTYTTYQLPKNVYLGEVRYVSRNNDQEDNGWLLTFVTDTREDPISTYLYIFDAQDISKGPLTILSIPVNIPIGFHTVWIDKTAT